MRQSDQFCVGQGVGGCGSVSGTFQRRGREAQYQSPKAAALKQPINQQRSIPNSIMTVSSRQHTLQLCKFHAPERRIFRIMLWLVSRPNPAPRSKILFFGNAHWAGRIEWQETLSVFITVLLRCARSSSKMKTILIDSLIELSHNHCDHVAISQRTGGASRTVMTICQPPLLCETNHLHLGPSSRKAGEGTGSGCWSGRLLDRERMHWTHVLTGNFDD
jgi:hypothetical protein